MKCANCGKQLYQGLDVQQVTQGVIGPRGFVPLDTITFCSDRCVSTYYSDPTSDDREDDVPFT